VLVTNGEILQNAINYNITDVADLMKRIASFTLGDAVQRHAGSQQRRVGDHLP